MPSIVFVLSDGSFRTVEGSAGESVMRCAVDNGVPGIQAECGGALTCATCHVHVLGDWFGRFPPPNEAEIDLLEIVDDLQANSRLSCQLVLKSDFDDVRVAVP